MNIKNEMEESLKEQRRNLIDKKEKNIVIRVTPEFETLFYSAKQALELETDMIINSSAFARYLIKKGIKQLLSDAGK